MDPSSSFPVDPLAVTGVSSILGGAVALTLDPPKSRRDMGARLLTAVVCGVAFGGVTLRYLGLSMVDRKTGAPDYEAILAVGVAWGFVGWFVLGLIARTFTGWRDRGATAIDAAREIRDAAAGKDKQ